MARVSPFGFGRHRADAAAALRGEHHGEEVAEALALQHDVVLQPLRGEHRVAGAHRLHDAVVLPGGFTRPSHHPELQATVGVEAQVQCLGLLGQEPVGARLVDQHVEALVGLVIVVRRPVGLGLVAGPVRLAQGLLPFRREPARGEPAAHAFELRHHLEHFDELGRAEIADEDAPVRHHRHEAGRGELEESLADRRPRQGEPPGQRRLVEPRAGRVHARHDLLFQDVAQPGRPAGPLEVPLARVTLDQYTILLTLCTNALFTVSSDRAPDSKAAFGPLFAHPHGIMPHGTLG